MAPANRCPQCGGDVPGDSPEGLCPACLLARAIELARGGLTRATLDEPAELPDIPRYRIIRLIGIGGMGTVYQAAQQQPQRTVALKVIKAGMVTSEILRRFTHESEVLGRLQ